LSNDTIIGFLLHGIEAEASLRSGDEKLTEALAPLRAKLDIIIEMLGRLSYRDTKLPPRRENRVQPDAHGVVRAPAPASGKLVADQAVPAPDLFGAVVLYGEVHRLLGDRARDRLSRRS